MAKAKAVAEKQVIRILDHAVVAPDSFSHPPSNWTTWPDKVRDFVQAMALLDRVVIVREDEGTLYLASIPEEIEK